MIDQLKQRACDLLGRPVYVCLQSEGAPAPLPSSYGCTSPTCDVLLRPWLESQGRWFGRRPAIFIDDLLLRANITAESPADADRLFARWLAAILIHELAHVVHQGVDLAEVTTDTDRRAMALAAFSISVQDSPSIPPWYGHNGEWVRLALHLAHRATARGQHVNVDDLFDGERYGIAEPSEWQYSLVGEEAALASASIFKVQHFRPPLGFIELWRRCVDRWRAGNPTVELDALGKSCFDNSLSLFS
jgi:hypothetical protein